jgi:hypothetical protein
MKYVVIALISILLGFGLSQQYFTETEQIVRVDTLTVIPEPIVIERVKPKIVYKSDTIVRSKPFTAVIDTVLKLDTIRVSYDFPENNMRLAIRMATDTVYNSYETIIEKCPKSKWWETPAIATGGVLLGILVTNVMR